MSNTDNNQIIDVLDALMGQGKSTWLIRKINQLMALPFEGKEAPRVIVITPYLTEIERFKSDCPAACFKSPEKYGSTKKADLNRLIEGGFNIVATHSLWTHIDRQTYSLLKQSSYTLFIDEALHCVDIYKGITKSDFEMLMKNEYISITDDDRIVWKEGTTERYKGKFEQFKSLCLNGNLYHWKKKIYWVFPTDIFNCFDEVWILTYMWQSSIMAAYVEAAGYRVHHHGMRDYQLMPHCMLDETELLLEYANLITIVDNSKLNSIGAIPKHNRQVSPLGVGGYRRMKGKQLLEIQRNIYNFFKYISNGAANDAMWTCFKAQKTKLKGSGYTKGFVSCNARATNEHRHRVNLAYMIDVHMNPVITTFIESRGVDAKNDQYALSSLVQWLFRSAIRDKKPITIYIPSERMRNLLFSWLNPSVVTALAA